MSLWGHQIPWESGTLLWNRDSHMEAFDPHRFQRDWFTRKRSLVTMGCKQRLHYWTPGHLSQGSLNIGQQMKKASHYFIIFIFIILMKSKLNVCDFYSVIAFKTVGQKIKKRRICTSMCSTPICLSVCQLRKSQAPFNTRTCTFDLIEITWTGLIYCARQI